MNRDKGHSHSTLLGNMAGGGAIACWSLAGVGTALGTRTLDAWEFLAMVALTGFLFLCVIQLVQRRPLVALIRHRRRIYAAAILGFTAYEVLLTLAIALASEDGLGQVLLLNYLWPVILAVLAGIFLGGIVHRTMFVLAIVLALTGLLLAMDLARLWHVPETLIPHALGTTAAVIWGIYSLLIRRWDALLTHNSAALNCLLCSLTCLIVVLLRGRSGDILERLNAVTVLSVLVTGVVVTGLAYLLWEHAMRRGDVPLVALMSYMTPILSILLVVLVFRESFRPSLSFAVAAVVAAALMGHYACTTSKKRRKKKPEDHVCFNSDKGALT